MVNENGALLKEDSKPSVRVNFGEWADKVRMVSTTKSEVEACRSVFEGREYKGMFVWISG